MIHDADYGVSRRYLAVQGNKDQNSEAAEP